MNCLKMCLNWKVLLGLALIAVGLAFAVSPAALKVALPFLLSAVCPLSMLLMMRGMRQQSLAAQPEWTPQPEPAPVPAPVAVPALSAREQA